MVKFYANQSLPNTSDSESRKLNSPSLFASIGLLASVLIMTGCGAAHQMHQLCRSQPIQRTSCDQAVSVHQHSYRQPTVPPIIQSPSDSQVDQSLMGGSGLATGDCYPTVMPVEVVPVPSQWSNPIQQDSVEPSVDPTVEPKFDRMELEEPQASDPMEI